MKMIPCSFKYALNLIVIGWLSTLAVMAQVEQVARYEREQRFSDPELILIPMFENGMALFNDKDKFREGKKLWDVIFLNTDLKEQWSLELETEPRHKIVGYEYNGNLIYLLFRTNDHEGSDLSLVTVHSKTQEVKKYSIKQELTFKITHFGVLTQTVVLGGYVNQDPAIIIFDLDSENLKIVPGFFVSDTELLDLRMNSNNTFNTLVIDRKAKEKRRLMLKTFDVSGAMLFDDIIQIDERRTILSGTTSTLVNDELLVTGTWSEGTSKQASGIYSVMADPFSDQPIKFYDFGSLQNFLEFQSPKRAAKLKEKASEAKTAGAIPDFKVHASVIRLDEQPGMFSLLTEVYQPSSNSNNASPYWSGFGGYPYSPYGGYSPYYGYNPFMNRYYRPTYQYNNPTPVADAKILYSSLLIFDIQGNLVHDYGLVLDDKKVNALEQTSDFIYNNGNATLAYKKEKDLFVIRHTPDGSKLDTLKTTLSKPEETIRSDSDNGNVRFWYQDFMYVWGHQQIKNQDKKSDDPNRHVFYINKIRID